MVRQVRRPTGSRDSDDARFAIDQFGKSITHADSKAGLLAAALTVLVASLAQQGPAIARRMPPASILEWTVLVGLLASTAATLLAIGFLVCAVVPRFHVAEHFSRYSWPAVADAAIADLVMTDEHTDREQSWGTAVVLASIARAKFRNIRWAMLCLVLGMLALLVAALGSLGH